MSDQSELILPSGLVDGRHTPLFGDADLPKPLLAVHRTTVWATLHVQTGSVRYVDLAGPDPRDQRLGAGDEAVIAPGVDHQIEPSTDATFFLQFYRESTGAPSARHRRCQRAPTDTAERGTTGAGTSIPSKRSSRW